MRKLNLVATLLGLAGAIAFIAGCQTAGTGATDGSLRPASTGPAHLTEVSLFPNGFGVFEYQGVVHNNATQTLTFRGDQINDVLGSMVFQDAGGGHVGEITFPTQTPLSTLLHGFRVDLDGLPSRFDMLAQLRGVSVTVALRKPAQKRITGRIIDLRSQHPGILNTPLVVRAGNRPVIRQHSSWVINLLCGSTIRQINVRNVAAITIRDAAVRRSFGRALDALADQPDRSSHPVTVWFHGHGRRAVGFAYITETPVWRMTYRIIEPAGKQRANTGAPAAHPATATLQGMAIVANQSSADWNNVRLDIRGGEPVSFLSDLYQPLYMRRPVHPQPPGLFPAPQTYDRALTGHGSPTIISRQMYDQLRAHAVAAAQGGGQSFFSSAGGATFGLRAQDAASEKVAMSRIPFNPLAGVQAMADAGKAHPAFDYHVNKISVARGQSAMAPVLVAPIQAEPVDYYSAVDMNGMFGASPYPFLALQLKNNTGKFLPGGPAAVYQGATLAGQATLPSMKPGQRHTLRFAVDRAMRVMLNLNKVAPPEMTKAGVKAGVVAWHFNVDTRYRFVATNSAATPRKLVLESTIQWNGLISPSPASLPKPKHQVWRFKLTVPAHGRKVLNLTGRTYQQDSVSLAAMNSHGLTAFLKKHPTLPLAVVAAIHRGQKLNATVDAATKAIASTNVQLSTVKTIIAQLEQSLATEKKVTPAYTNMATLLNKQDVLFVELNNTLARQNTQLSAAQSAANRYWNDLNIPVQPARGH